MSYRRFGRFWGCMAILLMCLGCRLPTEIKTTYSLSNEILVFSSNGEILRRVSGLPGIPTDIEFLPNGHAVVAIEAVGLILLNPQTGRTSAPFGPPSVWDVDVIAGTTINDLQPFYLTVGEEDETAQLLNEQGNPIGAIAIPKGTRSIHYLDTGNFLLANVLHNKIYEVASTGQIVWESLIPLNHPFDVLSTPQGTIWVSDFDNHRLIEIDRQNHLLRTIPGYNHPRRIQLLPDGNILTADSDLRRIAALAPPNILFPIVSDLNRPHSLAYHPHSQILLVGIEPFFRLTPGDLIASPSQNRILFLLVGAGGSLLLAAILLLATIYKKAIGEKGHVFLAGWRSLWESLHPAFLIAAIVFCAIASRFFALKSFSWGIGLMALGLLLAVLARYRRPDEISDSTLVKENHPIDRAMIQRPFLLGVGLMLFWWAFLGAHYNPLSFWPLLPWLIAPWVCGLSLRKRSQEKSHPHDLLWLSLILMVALFFRVYQIHDIPYGLWLDEVFSLWDALHESANNSLAPFHTTPLIKVGEFDIPNLYLVMLLLVSKTVGASFLMVKSFSVIPSLGIVLGVYCLGKWTLGPWAGRLGALLIAMNSWQVTFARWGWLQQWYVCLAVFALAYYLRSHRWKCPRSAAYAGLFLGLGFYTYIPILLTAITLALLFVISFLEPARRTHGKLMLIAGIHFFLVFAPLWDYYQSAPGIFTTRANVVSIQSEIFEAKSLKPLMKNLQKYGLMLHVEGDYNPRHNIANQPLLDPLTGGLFLVGLALTVIRFYRPAERTILLALLIALAGGIYSLSREAPNSFRTGTFGPLVCLLSAIPLASLLQDMQNRPKISLSKARQFYRIVAISFTFILLTSIAIWNGYRYFVVYPSNDIWGATFGAVQHCVYTNLTPSDLGYERLYIHPMFNNRTFNIYTYFLEVEKLGPQKAELHNLRYQIWDLKNRIPQLATGTSTFIMPTEYETILREAFPEIEIRTINNPYGVAQAILGRVFIPDTPPDRQSLPN